MTSLFRIAVGSRLSARMASRPISFNVICHPERSEGPAFVRVRTKKQQVLRFAQDDKIMGSTAESSAGRHSRTELAICHERFREFREPTGKSLPCFPCLPWLSQNLLTANLAEIRYCRKFIHEPL